MATATTAASFAWTHVTTMHDVTYGNGVNYKLATLSAMSGRDMDQVLILINLWHNEPSLWDNQQPCVSAMWIRKAAMNAPISLLKISHAYAKFKNTFLNFAPLMPPRPDRGDRPPPLVQLQLQRAVVFV